MSMKQSGEIQIVCDISYMVESTSKVQIEKSLGVEVLRAVIMNIESEGIEDFMSLVLALERGEFWSKPMKLALDMKYR